MMSRAVLVRWFVVPPIVLPSPFPFPRTKRIHSSSGRALCSIESVPVKSAHLLSLGQCAAFSAALLPPSHAKTRCRWSGRTCCAHHGACGISLSPKERVSRVSFAQGGSRHAATSLFIITRTRRVSPPTPLHDTTQSLPIHLAAVVGRTHRGQTVFRFSACHPL